MGLGKSLREWFNELLFPGSLHTEPDLESIRSEYPFESHYMEIHGHRYHYVDEGEGDVVLLIHGNPTWSFFYRRMILALSQKYRVIAPDHMGCGLSDKPQKYEYRLENHIDNLETLVLRLKLNRITLIVHDWGGAIGMGCAIRHPQRFGRFVIMNTAAFSSLAIPKRIALCRLPLIGEFLVRGFNAFAAGAVHMASVNRLSPPVARGLTLPYDSYENRIAVARFVQDIPLSPEDPSYETLLQIEHGLWMFRERPIALIWGMQDWCFTPEAFLSRWKQIYPMAKTLEIEHAGHYLLEDAPVEIIRFISHFMADTEIMD